MKKKLFMACMAASIIFCAMGTKAYALGDVRIYGSIESSRVDVRLEKYDSRGQLTALDYENVEKVSPGQEVSGRVRIVNDGAECYVRMMPYAQTGTGVPMNVENLFYGMEDGWIKKEGGIFYLKNPLKVGESVDFCSGIKVPEGVSDFKVTYDLQAIQSANLEPDMEALNPWGSVEITKSVGRSGGFNMDVLTRSVGSEQNLTLYYNEEAEGLISNFDEIFRDMPLMHPGDSYEETIKLYNSTDTPKVLYMKDSTDKSELLDYVDVDVLSFVGGERREIFKGSLADTDTGEYTAVGTLMPNESAQLVIAANMDNNAGNEAAGLSSHISLNMEAVDEGEQPSGEGQVVRPVRTGDKSNPLVFMVIALILFAIGMCFMPKKKRR